MEDWWLLLLEILGDLVHCNLLKFLFVIQLEVFTLKTIAHMAKIN